MTKQERLKIYKKALRDYQLSRWIPLSDLWFNTECGFCFYFTNQGLSSSCLYLGICKEEFCLLELAKLRPDHGNMWWFPMDDLKSRIELLKKAIKMCE